MKDYKRRNLWMFPLGTVGRDMFYSLFGHFLLTYVMFTRTLTAAQLSAITSSMVAASVLVALCDPIIGNLIERTRTRFGKFKPWLAIGIVANAVVVYAAFHSTLQGWSFVAFFALIYFLYTFAFTLHDISYWGMVAALGSDADARNQFTSRASLFASIGGTIASMTIPIFTTGALAIGGSISIAYGRLSLLICILAPLFLCFTIFGVKEQRSETTTQKPPSVSFRKILSTVTGNDQLRWIAVIFLIQQVGSCLVLSGLGSTYIYFSIGYDGSLYSMFSTISVLATALLMLFYPVISRKIHRKPLMRIMMMVSVIGTVLMLISGLLVPADMLRFWGVTLGYTATNFGQYGFYLIMIISIANTVEYNEYRHGMRDEGIIASLRPFLTKLASALNVAITSLSYIVFGVTSYTNRISDLERAASNGAINEAEKLASIGEVLGGVQNWQTTGLFLCMTLIPIVLMSLSHVLYQRHYKLDEPEYDRICAELASRREETV